MSEEEDWGIAYHASCGFPGVTPGPEACTGRWGQPWQIRLCALYDLSPRQRPEAGHLFSPCTERRLAR
jgi:hypothetical protein